MKLERDKIFMIVAAVFVLVFGAMYFIDKDRGAVVLTRQDQQAIAESSVSNNSEVAAQILIVHIAGEVKSPGVYELTSGSRVMDALELAGGPTDDADLDRINLAAYLSDAQQVVIPKARAEGETGSDFAYETQSKLVNVNTADQRTLMTLPGVGEVTAGNIIAYREKNGAFKQIADIKNVPRIGERTFEQLQDLIAVD